MGCSTSTAFDPLASRPCHAIAARVPSVTGIVLGCVDQPTNGVVAYHHCVTRNDLDSKSCEVKCPFSFHLAILASVGSREEKVDYLLQHSCSSLFFYWEAELLAAAVYCSLCSRKTSQLPNIIGHKHSLLTYLFLCSS